MEKCVTICKNVSGDSSVSPEAFLAADQRDSSAYIFVTVSRVPIKYII
jgi:hypothetical protein